MQLSVSPRTVEYDWEDSDSETVCPTGPTPPRRAVARKPTVRKFLSSLNPSMENLLPVLMHFGVTSRVYLQALVDLPEVQMCGFVDSMPLSAIQAQLLLRGLKSLRLSSL